MTDAEAVDDHAGRFIPPLWLGATFAEQLAAPSVFARLFAEHQTPLTRRQKFARRLNGYGYRLKAAWDCLRGRFPDE